MTPGICPTVQGKPHTQKYLADTNGICVGGKEGGRENEAFGDKGDGGGSRESWRR